MWWFLKKQGRLLSRENGNLNRPLTSSKLKELLEAKYTPLVERESVAPSLGRLGRTIGLQSNLFLKRLFLIPSSTAKDDKK